MQITKCLMDASLQIHVVLKEREKKKTRKFPTVISIRSLEKDQASNIQLTNSTTKHVNSAIYTKFTNNLLTII